MKVRFIGDPNDGFSGPQVLTCWGVEFVKGGEFVEVTDERFARHSHFEVEGEAEEPEPKRRGRKAAAEEGEGA